MKIRTFPDGRKNLRLALYQPDIPQNTGAMMRLSACLGIGLDIIEPCGFVLDDKRLRRTSMDYRHQLDLRRHDSWTTFAEWLATAAAPRLVVLSTRAEQSYADFAYRPDDVILVGRESAGLPDEVHDRADARLAIPMADGVRSLNVVTAAAMVLGEGLRQTRWTRAGER
ncbi:MAG: tRNA (cytidine(34)-2'-O)-methyltransferase [Alphaproteobacteria bacterium]|nr:tRNA (cytidine(34)-2'-O)-methyltransferase [Alphaproteobacteria bacterium]